MTEETSQQETSPSKKDLEHRIEAIAKKKIFELENDLRPEPEDKHQWHRVEVGAVGASLVSLAYLWQSGSFLGLWILGFVLTFKDIQNILGKEESKITELLQNHPVYYVLGGLAASILMEGAGLTMPEPKFGLIANILSVVVGL